jgi:hypothetical protein
VVKLPTARAPRASRWVKVWRGYLPVRAFSLLALAGICFRIPTTWLSVGKVTADQVVAQFVTVGLANMMDYVRIGPSADP